MKNKLYFGLAVSVLFFFGVAAFLESSAWARAGGGGSLGSRGSRSFSAPRAPSSSSPSSPGISAPGRNPLTGNPAQPSTGFFSRSPFLQGLAGGLAGGLLGGMLFGGTGHAAGGGTMGGGIGLMDVALIGLLLYLGWRFLKRRRAHAVASGSYNGSADWRGASSIAPATYYRDTEPLTYATDSEVEQGFQQLRQKDPGFREEDLKETFQDVFFRIQAAWMNRSLAGVEGLLTDEMAQFFTEEFEKMKQQKRINRLENIAVRKVEPTEVWQETGKDYVTVLFTANLLDYAVDEATGEVLSGSKTSPVRFQEFWTFCRNLGSSQWQLSGINQTDEESAPLH
jgi:predicted lipid-binding transport protein (Tim44 family)